MLFDNYYSFNVGLFQTLQSSAKAAMSVEKLSSKRKGMDHINRELVLLRTSVTNLSQFPIAHKQYLSCKQVD